MNNAFDKEPMRLIPNLRMKVAELQAERDRLAQETVSLRADGDNLYRIVKELRAQVAAVRSHYTTDWGHCIKCGDEFPCPFIRALDAEPADNAHDGLIDDIHHCATKDAGEAYESAGYKEHVLLGKCPAISTSKSWCSLHDGHSGPHVSPRVPYPDKPINSKNPLSVQWIEVWPVYRKATQEGES